MIESTWATRELPILRAALQRVDAGNDLPELEEIRQDAGVKDVTQFRVAVRALHDAGYLKVLFTGGWTPDSAAGNVEQVYERTRRELGSWPAADDVVDRLVAALAAAAEQAEDPERKSKFRAASEALAGMARDITVSVIAKQIGE